MGIPVIYPSGGMHIKSPSRVASRFLVAQYWHGAAGVMYPLSDGVTLTHEGYGVWKARTIDGDLVASFMVSYYNGSDVPSVADAIAFSRGKGYGRQILRALVNHYGELRSSHSGNTSDAAQAMWKSFHPRVSWDSEDLDVSKFGGSRSRSYYYLSKDMLR